MELLNGILSRQSVREYDKSRSIEPEKIQDIVRAGMNAPSALGQHAWRFMTMTDHAVLSQIAALKDWWKMLEEASLGIGVMIDPAAADGLDEEFLVISAAAAAENMLLAAHSLGIGGVYLGTSKKETYYTKLSSALQIPDSLRMIGILSMGYPKETLTDPADRFEDGKWIQEHF